MARGNRIDKLKKIVNTQGPIPPAPQFPPETLQNPSSLANGLCDAVVGGSQNPNFLTNFPGFGGQGGFGGGFSGQQVEDTTTVFENLRWYLASNLRQLLSQAFVEIGLVQTICCVPVDDALRGGVLIKSKQINEEQIKELQLKLDREDDLGTAGWACKWDRLYGGAGILILADDQDPEEPFRLNSITPETNIDFRDVDLWELFCDKQATEGEDFDIPFEDPAFDFYNYYDEQIHRSRVMRLKGIKAPSFVRPRLRGWGLSEVERLVRSLNQYLKATDLGFEVLDEFKLDVYKIKNMVNTLLSPNGTNKIKERIQLANWQKNYQNALVMDSEDDFDHKQLSFSGLAEAMEGIRRQVASDMRMPLSKLFGTSEGGGIANTDQNDMENYNSMIESEVRAKVKYHLLKMLEIRCQQLFGFVPDDLEIEFKPLRELSAIDQEAVKTQKFTRLMQAKAAGEVTTLEFRDICNKGNLFDIQLDTDDASLNDEELADSVGEQDEAAANDPNSDDNDDETANRLDKKKMAVKNSPDFDKASYEADGGDEWVDPRRKVLFENPGNVDEGLWARAKEASKKAFGKEKWQFVTWWYKKQGGKFS